MKSNIVVILAITTLAIFTMAGVVVIAVAVPEGGNPGSLIALLIGTLAPTIAAIASVARIGQVDQKVDDLANGKMDRKIEAGLHRVLDNRQARQ